jgi:hypothetical protein
MEKYPAKEEKFKQSEIKEDIKKIDNKKKEKLYWLENRHNYPYELQIGKFFQRFEPRNKEGCKQKIEERIIFHKDFQYCKKHFIITEVN